MLHTCWEYARAVVFSQVTNYGGGKTRACAEIASLILCAGANLCRFEEKLWLLGDIGKDQKTRESFVNRDALGLPFTGSHPTSTEFTQSHRRSYIQGYLRRTVVRLSRLGRLSEYLQEPVRMPNHTRGG